MTVDPLASALFTHHPDLASLEFLRHLPLADNFAERRRRWPLLWSILEEVAGFHDLEVSALFARCKREDVVLARDEFYYRAATETTFSYPEIGRFIGRDHTSIINGICIYCLYANVPAPRSLNPEAWVKRKKRAGRLYHLQQMAGRV